MMLEMLPSRRPLRVLHTADVHLEHAHSVFRRIIDCALTDEDRYSSIAFASPSSSFPETTIVCADEIRDCGWDYVALGHQHVRTDVSQGSVAAYYAGAPLTDGRHPDRVVLRIDFSVDGGIRVQPRMLAPATREG